MSRLRSQLDTILSGNGQQGQPQAENSPAPRPAYPGHPASPQPSAPHSSAMPNNVSAQAGNMENIQASLDRLAGKLSTLSATANAGAQQASGSHNLQEFQRNILGELRSGFEQVNRELGEVKQAHATHTHENGLDADLKRIADGIAMLQQNQGANPDHMEKMNAELHNLRSGLDELARRPQQQIDLSAIAKSIEAGYNEIAGKLDQHFEKSASSLSDSVNLDKQLRHMSERIEEVTRSVVALSVTPETDQKVFDRLEARLSSLTNSVDRILEVGSQPAEPSVTDLEPVTTGIERLSEKLDNMSAMTGASEHLAADFGGVTQRLDTLQSDFNTLTAHLASLENQASRDGSGVDGEALTAIEKGLSEIADRLDRMPQDNTPAANSESAEILSVLRDLVERVNNIPNTMPAQASSSAEMPDLGSLEAQLAGIAAQLGTASQTSLDMQPLTERLDNIESQIAASRDIVIELAGQASARTDGQAGEGALDRSQIDEISGSLASIAQRLENLEGQAASLADQAALDRPASTPRSSFEHAQQNADLAENAGSQPLESGHAEPEVAMAPQHEPGHIDEAPSMDLSLDAEPRLDEEGAAFQEEQIEMVPPGLGGEDSVHETGEALLAGDMSEMKFENGDDATQAQATPPVVEDIPLEPGSGMPDLEALVRNATKRKQEIVEEDDSSTGDLIAAARRAAQAAAMQSQQEEEIASRQAKPSPLSRLGSLKLPSLSSKANPRKALLASVAVVALGVAAYTMAPRVKALLAPGEVNQVEISGQNENAAPEEMAASPEIVNEAESQLTENEADLIVDEVAPEEMLQEGDASEAPAMQATETAEAGTEGAGAGEMLASGESAQPPAAEMSKEAETTPVVDAANSDMTPPKEIGNQALIQAAASGDGNALFEVGRRYTDGVGVDRSLQEAIKWYELAAKQGHVPSQYRLGNFYEKGHGVAADPAKAAVWYVQAAEKGNALAMHNLAVLNAMGVIDGNPDMDKAVELFTNAANLGVKDSQVNLGILYTKGMGVDEDLEKAYKWFAIASRAGDQDAAKKRDTIAAAMRPEQLEKGRAAAEAWKPQELDTAANIAEIDPEWNSAAPAKRVSKKEIIRQTQSMLAKAGFDPGPADGIFGLKTRDAIISFQKKVGMEANGEISPKLLEQLSKVSI